MNEPHDDVKRAGDGQGGAGPSGADADASLGRDGDAALGRDDDRSFGSDRRAFLKQGAFAAGSAAFGIAGNGHRHRARSHRHPRPARSRSRQPNILMIIVDQMRTPVWMPPGVTGSTFTPNIAALKRRSVSFERHYTASNDCSPARSVLLTGLYTHQTGVMITGGSWLDPRFPTWGGLLRQMGYKTAYYGKWHLNPNPMAPLEQYGFEGGTYPSPNGGPGQGTRVDPSIANQFIQWLDANGGDEPWCATASFVNPHDIAWWWRYTSDNPSEASPPSRASSLPPNFETPQQLAAKGKPMLQRSLQDTANRSFGEVPFAGPEALAVWTQMMDTYLMLQSYVDVQVGRVLAALEAKPKIARDTVVLFTADHGEYAGSHGMRGKGASAYEEALRVPFFVHDPRGQMSVARHVGRTQLTSSADVVALMLTIASGSNAWRGERDFSHLSSRLDMARICAEPTAKGRDWVLHATDEDVTEFASEPYAADAPRHVVALRTAQAKIALYSNWRPGTMEVEQAGQEVEVYDYSTPEGRMECSSQLTPSPLEEGLRATLEDEAIPHELRAPLPARLHVAHSQGLQDYGAVERFHNEKLAEIHSGQREPQPEPL